MEKDGKIEKTPSLEERITKIELLLQGDDKEPNHSNWSYEQIRVLLDKSGLTPNMARNQELCGLDMRVDELESLIKHLGQTDAHIGEKTLENRLSVIEGIQSIFCSAHKGHTNYSETEYYGMHENIESKKQQLDGIQKKVDRIVKLLENAKVELSFQEALKL